jgi:hypothetical protein
MMEGQLFTRPYPCDPIGRRTGRQVTMRHRRLMQQDLTSERTSLTSDIRHQTTSCPSIDLLWQATTETPSTPTTPHSRPRPGLQTRRNIMTTLTPPSVVCQTDGTRTLPSRQLRLPEPHFVPLEFRGSESIVSVLFRHYAPLHEKAVTRLRVSTPSHLCFLMTSVPRSSHDVFGESGDDEYSCNLL